MMVNRPFPHQVAVVFRVWARSFITHLSCLDRSRSGLCFGATPLCRQRCNGRLEDLRKHKQADSGLSTKAMDWRRSSVRPEDGPFTYGKYFESRNSR